MACNTKFQRARFIPKIAMSWIVNLGSYILCMCCATIRFCLLLIFAGFSYYVLRILHAFFTRQSLTTRLLQDNLALPFLNSRIFELVGLE